MAPVAGYSMWLTISPEIVGQLVSVSISGRQVARFLDQLRKAQGRPNKIVFDNGTELTSKAMYFGVKNY
jgi:putative transposase